MAWDFTADSSLQDELSTKLTGEAEQFQGKKDELFGSVDNLANYWEGADVDTFRTSAHGYEGAVTDLGNSINMFGIHFGLMSAGTVTLASDLVTIIKNLTNGGAPGGGSGGPGGSSGDSGSGDTPSGNPAGNPGGGDDTSNPDGSETPDASDTEPTSTDPNAIVGKDGTEYEVVQGSDDLTIGNGGQYVIHNEDGTDTILSYVGANGTYPGQPTDTYSYQFKDEDGNLHTYTLKDLQGMGAEKIQPKQPTTSATPQGTGTGDGPSTVSEPRGPEQMPGYPGSQGSTPTAKPVEPVEPVTLVRGDTVKVGDEAYTYYGTTSDGTNLYRDPNTDVLYYSDGQGGLKKSNGTAEWFTNYGINVNGEVVYPGDVSSAVKYQNGADSPVEYVASGGQEAWSTYTHGDSSVDFRTTTTSITASNENSDFITAVNNHESICVDAGIKVQADPGWNGWDVHTLSDGRSKTYLVYDQGTGMYYVASADGTYNTNGTGYAPEDLAGKQGGVYFH